MYIWLALGLLICLILLVPVFPIVHAVTVVTVGQCDLGDAAVVLLWGGAIDLLIVLV